jgi:hypothetical protein
MYYFCHIFPHMEMDVELSFSIIMAISTAIGLLVKQQTDKTKMMAEIKSLRHKYDDIHGDVKVAFRKHQDDIKEILSDIQEIKLLLAKNQVQ